MTLNVDSRIALDEVFRRSYEATNKQLDSIPAFFLKEVTEKVKGQVTQETSQEEREQVEKAVRLEVYRDICNSKVDSRVFLRHIQAVLNGPEALFQFRRTFAGQPCNAS
jgi:hypothetical protein